MLPSLNQSLMFNNELYYSKLKDNGLMQPTVWQRVVGVQNKSLHPCLTHQCTSV